MGKSHVICSQVLPILLTKSGYYLHSLTPTVLYRWLLPRLLLAWALMHQTFNKMCTGAFLELLRVKCRRVTGVDAMEQTLVPYSTINFAFQLQWIWSSYWCSEGLLLEQRHVEGRCSWKSLIEVATILSKPQFTGAVICAHLVSMWWWLPQCASGLISWGRTRPLGTSCGPSSTVTSTQERGFEGFTASNLTVFVFQV